MAATVLCVDNDRDLCRILAKALTGEGYRVLTEYHGEKALVRVAEEPPDLMLLDVLLPGKDGFEVLEALRAVEGPSRGMPVVLISGCSPTPEYTSRAEALGAAALLIKPVPLDHLLEVVREQIGESAGGSADGAAAATGASRGADSDLSGALEQLPMPALLHHLHGLRATGVLHLTHGRKRKWIQLRDGYPVAVRSNLVNECLGNYLARAGKISPDDVEESRRRMEPGTLQGEILVAMERVSEAEVAAALREQAEEKLFEIFAWQTGSFRFERGAVLQRANELALERSPANLILQGVRQRLPLERVDAHLRANAMLFVAPGRSPFYRFQEIDLEPEQDRLFCGLDGTQRVAAFHDAAPDLRRTLYALLATGLLELRGDRQDAVPRPEREAPPAPTKDETLRAELTDLLQRLRGKDHFEVLGVDPEAGDEQLCAAYERLSESTHPDRVSASSDAVKKLASEAFSLVARAYETLSNPRRRQEFVLGQRRASREAAEREEGRRALSAEVQFQKGETALRQRAYQIALQCFGKALELYPDEGEYHAHYGWTLHVCHPDDRSMTEEAKEHVKRGIKLASDREKPYLFMGRLCKATGSEKAAEKMFTRAVQIQPNCVEALRELRLINMRREKGRGLIGRLIGR
jgi:CheY-like chemotaxis protein/curved DNA-binding protein CbpA